MSTGANRIWAADITHIPTRQGWLYLAIVLNLHSRRIVDWAMSDRIQQPLTTAALAMALTHRRPAPGVIHHGDRGSRYTSQAYRDQIGQAGLIASTSRVAMPYDNAVVESFFSSLKNELTHHERFDTIDQARHKLFDYIEVFYNRQRKHRSLGYCSPVHSKQRQNVLKSIVREIAGAPL